MFANLNVRERFPLESQRGLEAHPPEMTRKTMLLPLATARITNKCQYFARGVVSSFGFATPLDEYYGFAT